MNISTPSKFCSKCGGLRDREGQRYCRQCISEYNAARREGKTAMLLTPAERDVVLAMRASASA